MSQTLGPFDISIEFPDGTMALVATVETFVINPGPTRVVTAIHVPKAHRGQGHGRDLLRRLCAVADEHKTALYLNVTPFDNSPLDHVRLTAWYERSGFTGRNGVF
jgi:ribosomal protein S18 acetylase RimI-like enzyme